MAFYATTAPGSAFLTDTRPPDLVGTVGLVNLATAGDVNRAVLPQDDTAYYSLPAANATTRFEALADRAALQGGRIMWEGEAGGAASPGVRYALSGDGVSNAGSWLFDQPGALTRIAYHGSALDVLRARRPALDIGFEFGLPASATPASAAAHPAEYAALRVAEDSALAAKVDFRIVPAFTPDSNQSAWRAQVDFFGDQIPGGVPVMLMVNHTIGADNGSNYDETFWRYQLDTAAEKGWDVLFYNLDGPRAAEAWDVVRGYSEGAGGGGSLMALVSDLADAVRDALNAAPGGTFAEAFEAKRKWLPRVELAKMGTALRVSVVPQADDRSVSSRTGIGRDIPIDIGVQKKLPPDTDPDSEAANAYIDPLVTLVESMATYLKPGQKLGNVVIVRTLVDPVCDREQLAQFGIFTSVVSVFFKVA